MASKKRRVSPLAVTRNFELGPIVVRAGRRAARKAIAQAHRAGLPAVMMRGDQIVNLYPDGSVKPVRLPRRRKPR